jgi:hypothetical protein
MYLLLFPCICTIGIDIVDMYYLHSKIDVSVLPTYFFNGCSRRNGQKLELRGANLFSLC